MEEIYKIDIYNHITGLNEPDSGFYTGKLEDILKRLTYSEKYFNIQIKVSKIEVKSINMNHSINHVNFICNDDVDLSFAEKINHNEYKC